jgi:hypothetical protein
VLICRVMGERWKAFLRQYPDLSLPKEMQRPCFKARMRRLHATFLEDCPSFTVLDLSFNDVRPSPLWLILCAGALVPLAWRQCTRPVHWHCCCSCAAVPGVQAE